jgi:uncharacterized phiE125 gp8 family phage protein
MRLEVATVPTEEPVSLASLKLHARVEDTTDDDLIAELGVSARQRVESDTGRALCTQKWVAWLDAFPDSSSEPIYLPLPPLFAVTKISYYNTSGVLTEWGATYYQTDGDTSMVSRARVLPAYGQDWPSTRDMLNAVKIEFTCGYGVASTVPRQLRHAIKLLVGTWYEHRETLMVGTNATEIPAPASYGWIIGPFVTPKWD